MARHVRLLPDGKFAGVTPQGKRMVEYLRLNVPEKVASRSRLLYIFENQDRFGGPLLDYFRYPLDLPDLSVLKPPGKNSRPRGVALSHLARKAKRVLPEYY